MPRSIHGYTAEAFRVQTVLLWVGLRRESDGSPEVLRTALALLSKYQAWLLWLLPLLNSLTPISSPKETMSPFDEGKS